MLTLRAEYIRWHALRTFFEDLALWRGTCRWVGLEPVERQEYERLLMGTDADVYVPLWASACLTGEDVQIGRAHV